MNTVDALKLAASLALGFGSGFLLLFAVGESAGGDWSGLAHLARAILMGLLIWLGWKRPLWAGIVAVVLGLLSVGRFDQALLGRNLFGPLAIYIAPRLRGGILLLVAARIKHRPA